jgi:tRNA-splicing ligase RtcB
MTKDPRLVRLDPTRLKIVNQQAVDATLFANEQVPVESSAVDELIGLTELRQTTELLAENDAAFFDEPPELKRIAITPDFHKGAGIPIGTVLATRGYLVPQAIGNDINCGMRLHVTSLSADRVTSVLDDLEARCRHTYFEGGRNIPMSRVQRQAMFQEGLPGLANATPKSQGEGLWRAFHERDVARDVAKVHAQGSFRARRIFGLDDFLGPKEGLTRDGQIGSIGGGNHFVEVQRIARILDGATAHAWGLKQGMVTVMVHSGSLSIGHHCGSRFRDVLRKIYPQNLRHPENGVFLLPQGDRHRDALDLFWDAMSNAANFAFANRMFLALMAISALGESCGTFDVNLLYDAPHNLVWKEQMDGEEVFLHRKGACPARGYEAMENTPFAYFGEPVLVPGSMGASSFILAGRGNADSLWSASHGAGRALSRGDALHGHDKEFEEFMRRFRVVTPVDLRRPDIAMRRDIVEKKLEDIKKEAPYAYKGIGPIINTLTEAGIAAPVAELEPLMTVKG